MTKKAAAAKRPRLDAETKAGLAFTSPFIIGFLLFMIVPMMISLYYSLCDYNILSAPVFVGLKNYIKLFTTDTRYWNSMLFTFKNTLVVVVFSNLIGFWLAYGLAKKVPFRNFMRAAFYLPRLIGGVILGFVWQFIFLNIFPFLGEKLGWSIFNLNWLGTPSTAFWGLAIVQIWGMAGYMMIIYIAGLQAVPEDMLEAAKIDGASRWQTLWKVTIPNVMPSITICTFLSLTNGFKLFDQNLALTGGQPYTILSDGSSIKETEMLALNILNTFYGQNANSRGTAQAKAVLFFILVATIGLLQLSANRKKEVQQ